MYFTKVLPVFLNIIIWDKVFKNGPSKICGRQPLKNLKGYGLLQIEAATKTMFCKKRCFQKFHKIHRKAPVTLLTHKAYNFIKKEALAQVFSCEFEISKNTFFIEYLWTTASVQNCQYNQSLIECTTIVKLELICPFVKHQPINTAIVNQAFTLFSYIFDIPCLMRV